MFQTVTMKSFFCALATSLLFQLAVPLTFAQSGDKSGEDQKSLVPEKLIPPAPALSPEEAMKTFKLQKGFRLELVAAEDRPRRLRLERWG